MNRILITAPLVLLLFGFGVASWAGIRWNMSDSFPPGIYQQLVSEPRRDQLAFVCLPRRTAEEALAKRYIRPGSSCPGGAQSLLKKIAGLPGDHVEFTDQGVTVNGRLYPNTRQLPMDGAGNPMEGKTGSFEVPPGHLIVLSDYNPLSFDSRYFGAIPDSGYLGGARALIQW